MLELIDSHTHLDAKDFDTDRESVIQRAKDAGVTRLISIGAGYGAESAARAIAISEKYDFVWASVGIHPHDAKSDPDQNPDQTTIIRSLALHPRAVAIGETGLDFYRDWGAPRELQEKWFRFQIALAIELNKPLIIHSREAGNDCLKMLRDGGAEKCGGVFHCYAENEIFAAELRKINFLISIPGTLTFKKADALRAIVKEVPLEQIMLETDAPYMAPEPHRGKRCESSFMVETAKMLAKVKGLSLEQVAAQTTKTAEMFFKLPKSGK